MVVLGRVHGEVEKCFDLISDLKCRDDRYPGRCRRGFGSWGVAVGPVRARGGGGVPQKTFPLTRRDRGGGCSTPIPHGGRFSIDTPPGRASPPSRRIPRRDSVSVPCTAIRSIARDCPPPVEGAGGGRASGREAGVIRLFAGKDVPGEMQETGARRSPVPSPSAPPPGGRFPHRYTASE